MQNKKIKNLKIETKNFLDNNKYFILGNMGLVATAVATHVFKKDNIITENEVLIITGIAITSMATIISDTFKTDNKKGQEDHEDKKFKRK